MYIHNQDLMRSFDIIQNYIYIYIYNFFLMLKDLKF